MLQASLLLPLLFEGQRDPERPLAVLDLGEAVAETVQFFAGYRCRLCFADLLEEPELLHAERDEAEQRFTDLFRRLLRGRRDGDGYFDLCLFWDLLNYLDPVSLRAFGAALRPFVHRGTRAHGFGAFKSISGTGNLQYGVQDTDRLIVRERSGVLPPSHAHSRTRLAESLRCFEITRGTLLRDGSTEFLLQGL